ncbi:MAG: hypothetical protein AAFO69_01815 [Bacteroidota bacterium]
MRFYQLNNYVVYHVYAVAEYIILSQIYGKAFNNRYIKNAYTLSAIGICSFAIINAAFLQSIQTPNSNITSPSFIVWILSAVCLFFYTLQSINYQHLEKSSLFWFNIGVLIYFSGSFILIAFGGRFLPTSLTEHLSIWKLHVFFNFLHYLTFNIALWMKEK